MQKVKTSHKGRKCKFLHCKQVLNIYNHEAYCHVHLSRLVNEQKPKPYKST